MTASKQNSLILPTPDMKILMLTPIYPKPDRPGLGIYVQRIESIYLELGYVVERVDYEPGPGFSGKVKGVRRFLKDIRRKVKEGDYDLVNVQYPFLVPLAFTGLKLDRALVTTLHGTDAKPTSLSRKWMKPWLNDLLRKSQMILVNSSFFKSFVVGSYGVQDDRVQLCPAGGFDQEVFFPESDKHGGEVTWLGFAGRLTEKKGWRLALGAFEALVAKRERPLGIKFAGQGEGSRILAEEARRILQTYPDARIEILGHLDDFELADFYRSLDLFLFPTLFEESLGLVAVESLASGCPVLASRTGATVEYIHEGQNGFLFEPGNKGALLSQIERFLDLTKEDQMIMRQKAAESVAAYSRARTKVRLQNLLESLPFQA